MSEARELTAMEEIQIFTLAHFYVNHSEFINGDGLTLQDKEELFGKYITEVVTAVSAAIGFCNLTDNGLEAIRDAFDEITSRGYDKFDRESFLEEMK